MTNHDGDLSNHAGVVSVVVDDDPFECVLGLVVGVLDEEDDAEPPFGDDLFDEDVVELVQRECLADERAVVGRLVLLRRRRVHVELARQTVEAGSAGVVVTKRRHGPP